MRKDAWRYALLALVLGVTGLAAHARGVELPARVYFSADATIDASGNASIGELSGAHGELANALKAQLQAQRFEPARRDGVAVESTTYLTAAAVLAGDSDVRVEGIRTGPSARKIDPPMYPAEMARHDVAASALVVFSISEEGKPQGVQFVDVTDARIVASLEKVVKRWRFAPERIAGRVPADVVAMPVWFVPFRKRDETAKPVFSCPPAGERPHARGTSDSCLDMIEVTYLD